MIVQKWSNFGKRPEQFSVLKSFAPVLGLVATMRIKNSVGSNKFDPSSAQNFVALTWFCH